MQPVVTNPADLSKPATYEGKPLPPISKPVQTQYRIEQTPYGPVSVSIGKTNEEINAIQARYTEGIRSSVTGQPMEPVKPIGPSSISKGPALTGEPSRIDMPSKSVIPLAGYTSGRTAAEVLLASGASKMPLGPSPIQPSKVIDVVLSRDYQIAKTPAGSFIKTDTNTFIRLPAFVDVSGKPAEPTSLDIQRYVQSGKSGQTFTAQQLGQMSSLSEKTSLIKTELQRNISAGEASNVGVFEPGGPGYSVARALLSPVSVGTEVAGAAAGAFGYKELASQLKDVSVEQQAFSFARLSEIQQGKQTTEFGKFILTETTGGIYATGVAGGAIIGAGVAGGGLAIKTATEGTRLATAGTYAPKLLGIGVGVGLTGIATSSVLETARTSPTEVPGELTKLTIGGIGAVSGAKMGSRATTEFLTTRTGPALITAFSKTDVDILLRDTEQGIISGAGKTEIPIKIQEAPSRIQKAFGKTPEPTIDIIKGGISVKGTETEGISEIKYTTPKGKEIILKGVTKGVPLALATTETGVPIRSASFENTLKASREGGAAQAGISLRDLALKETPTEIVLASESKIADIGISVPGKGKYVYKGQESLRLTETKLPPKNIPSDFEKIQIITQPKVAGIKPLQGSQADLSLRFGELKSKQGLSFRETIELSDIESKLIIPKESSVTPIEQTKGLALELKPVERSPVLKTYGAGLTESLSQVNKELVGSRIRKFYDKVYTTSGEEAITGRSLLAGARLSSITKVPEKMGPSLRSQFTTETGTKERNRLREDILVPSIRPITTRLGTSLISAQLIGQPTERIVPPRAIAIPVTVTGQRENITERFSSITLTETPPTGRIITTTFPYGFLTPAARGGGGGGGGKESFGRIRLSGKAIRIAKTRRAPLGIISESQSKRLFGKATRGAKETAGASPSMELFKAGITSPGQYLELGGGFASKKQILKGKPVALKLRRLFK